MARVVTPAGRGAPDTLPSALVLPNHGGRAPAAQIGAVGTADVPPPASIGRMTDSGSAHRSAPAAPCAAELGAASALIVASVPRSSRSRRPRRTPLGLDAVSTSAPNTVVAVAPPAADPWTWPVPAPIRVVAPFRAPPTPYKAGHRGIDLLVEPAATVVAPAPGTVSFAGMVAGRGVVAIDHGDGVVSAIEPVAASVAQGDVVSAGDVIGTVAQGGHCTAGLRALRGAGRRRVRVAVPVPRRTAAGGAAAARLTAGAVADPRSGAGWAVR